MCVFWVWLQVKGCNLRIPLPILPQHLLECSICWFDLVPSLSPTYWFLDWCVKTRELHSSGCGRVIPERPSQSWFKRSAYFSLWIVGKCSFSLLFHINAVCPPCSLTRHHFAIVCGSINVQAFQFWEKYLRIVKQSSLWSLGRKISPAGVWISLNAVWFVGYAVKLSSLLKALLVKILTSIKSSSCVVSALVLGIRTEGDIALWGMEKVSFVMMGCRRILTFHIVCLRKNADF